MTRVKKLQTSNSKLQRSLKFQNPKNEADVEVFEPMNNSDGQRQLNCTTGPFEGESKIM